MNLLLPPLCLRLRGGKVDSFPFEGWRESSKNLTWNWSLSRHILILSTEEQIIRSNFTRAGRNLCAWQPSWGLIIACHFLRWWSLATEQNHTHLPLLSPPLLSSPLLSSPLLSSPLVSSRLLESYISWTTWLIFSRSRPTLINCSVPSGASHVGG